MHAEHLGPNRLPDATRIDRVELQIADLERSTDFYTRVIGLERIEDARGRVALGVAGRTLLVLLEHPGASPAVVEATGLYHFAILVGSRLNLGRSLARLAECGYPLGGASDHLVSEALYLSDPDGNGIEIYRDRPRHEWSISNGELRMATLPLDLRALLAEAESEPQPWDGLSAETTIGHIHLQVDDLDAAGSFYRDVIGFDVMVDLSRMGALFLAAGGYHHHIGLNTWHSRGGSRRPADAAGLVSFSVDLGSADELAALRERLARAGSATEGDADALTVMDPAGNTVVIGTGLAKAGADTAESTS